MGLIQTVNKDRKIYGNYKVFSPDGFLMFRCDIKKANWYLSRNLADMIDSDPFNIKLKFEPKGLGNHNKNYGLTEMDNKCVVCGTNEFLTRHHVVPICYRRYFPVHVKSHNFHDVLSLCVGCHENYETFAFEYKLKLADEYDVPINGELCVNKDLLKIKRLVSCLDEETYPNIPNWRIKEMKNEIKSHFSWKKLTKKRIKNIVNTNISISSRTHGEIVISKVSDIYTFIRDWRKHFIENMDCKYLPKNWSIDNE
jgi:hypothetical protein